MLTIGIIMLFILSVLYFRMKYRNESGLNFRIFEFPNFWDHYDLHSFVSSVDYATGKTSFTDIRKAVVKEAAMNV